MNKRFDLQFFADDAPAAEAGAESTGVTGADDSAAKAKADSGKSEAKYTDADVDRPIDRKFAEWQKKQSQTRGSAPAFGSAILYGSAYACGNSSRRSHTKPSMINATCRCGPVENPLLPTAAIRSPCSTC